MLPADAPRAYNCVVPSRIVLWQHVGNLKSIGISSKKKWPAHAWDGPQDPELLCPTASH